MSVANIAALGSQTVLGLVGLGVGRAKVTHQEDQIEEFQRYGYPQWFRMLTGVLGIGAGIGLLVGLLWRPELTVVGGLLLSGVMAGVVVTHLRIGDPPAKAAVPAVAFTLTVTLLTYRYVPPSNFRASVSAVLAGVSDVSAIAFTHGTSVLTV